jgi:formate dehydrogenase subunit gamma
MTSPPEHEVTRYSFRERIVHALAAASYVYLLLTGLAFWTPALYWIAALLGGGYLARLLHPWAGVVFAVIVARMYFMWRHDMQTTAADLEWRRAIWQYISNQDDEVPAAGRFNFGQKQLFWVMVWSAVLLFVSGVVLWLPQAVPTSARWLRELAVIVHAVAALVTIGAFIVHLYMGLAVVPGGTRAIVHGKVTKAWARSHHRLWFESRDDPRR